jgi:hypothetical protein
MGTGFAGACPSLCDTVKGGRFPATDHPAREIEFWNFEKKYKKIEKRTN